MTNPVLKPEILKDEAECRALGITPDAPLFAVFGKPIGHSKSPLMQNAALEFMASASPVAASQYGSAKYFAFEVDPENLKETLGLFYEKNFIGINLTIPHKEIAMRCADNFDRSAKLANACNTLKRTEDGWRGYNTDGYGLERAIEENFNRKLDGSDIVLIGAGGAARGAAFYMSNLKNRYRQSPLPFAGIRSLTLVNRSLDRLEKLSKDLRSAGFENSAYALSDDDFYSVIAENSIIVNATSVGLKADDLPVLDFSKVPSNCAFFDMPYADGSETASVAAARRAGLQASDGLAMLAWQGAMSMHIWSGFDVLKLGRAMYGALTERQSEQAK